MGFGGCVIIVDKIKDVLIPKKPVVVISLTFVSPDPIKLLGSEEPEKITYYIHGDFDSSNVTNAYEKLEGILRWSTSVGFFRVPAPDKLPNQIDTPGKTFLNVSHVRKITTTYKIIQMTKIEYDKRNE